ncbi:sorcin [Diretmus argenteus]
MAYPGYGAPPPGGPAGDPLYGYFSAVAGQDGQISADELQACLTQSGMSGSYKPFSLETCRLMINMLDRDYSGSMGFAEFKELSSVLNGWKQNFMSYDHDRSGTVEGPEMQQSLASMGYNLSPNALNIIVRRYSFQGRIPFDEYVACCIKLRSLTRSATFQYDDFIQCTMNT